MFLQEYREKWVEVDSIRTHYFEAGTRRPLMLVYGGTTGDASGGANPEDFDRNFADLARKLPRDLGEPASHGPQFGN
jgi:hypothetical protein